MSFLLVGGVVAFISFGIQYVRQGRFGITVLALAAGYIVADLWGGSLVVLAEQANIHFPFITLNAAFFAALLLAPGIIAVLLSKKSQGIVPRFVAALLMAVFIVALLLPLFMPDALTNQVYAVMEENRNSIITGVLVIGLLDAVLARHPKIHKPGKD